MAQAALNLPVDIPWKLVATSPDMMDTTFANKRFPFAWRSSLALSAFEPDTTDLPAELCDERITYLKLTLSVTGYQPSKEEVDQAYLAFPMVPTEQLTRILGEYLACYGALINVAVFPHPLTKTRQTEACFDLAQMLSEERGEGTEEQHRLPNPYGREEVSFEVPREVQVDNHIVDIFPPDGDGAAELYLPEQMTITFPPCVGVTVKLVHYTRRGVHLDAFKGDVLVGTADSRREQGSIHELAVAGAGIDRAVLSSPDSPRFETPFPAGARSGASLTEVCRLVETSEPLGLSEYPHIVAFEPKSRDLYQAATDSGEILTASVSEFHTDKTLTHTDTQETGLSANAKVPGTDLGVGLSHSWGSTDQDQWTRGTDDSRDRRERHGTTSNLSQMYNLLTGYHAGTNRATFLMLPRPHLLQPTDRRTFVQGLRVIEGMQEFFLVVVRPRDVEGLCVEASLETSHLPEEVEFEEKPPEFEDRSELFTVTAWAAHQTPFKEIEKFPFATHTVPSGFVVDRTKGDPGHPGVGEGQDRSNQQAKDSLSAYNYGAISDVGVLVSGTIFGGPFPNSPDAMFIRDYTVFMRSEKPKPVTRGSKIKSRFLTTSRGLTSCLRSGEGCVEIVGDEASTEPPAAPLGDWIVDEGSIELEADLLDQDAKSGSRVPAMQEVLRGIRSTMSTSWKMPSREPTGEVGFLESTYFLDRISPFILTDRSVESVEGVPRQVVKTFGPDSTLDEVLRADPASVAKETGLSVEEVKRRRRRLVEQLGREEK